MQENDQHTPPTTDTNQGGLHHGLVAPLIMTAIVFFLLGGMSSHLFIETGSSSSQPVASVEEAVQATFRALTPTATPLPTRAPVSETVAEHNPFRGPEDAPVTIVEFSDYQCPFCARFHEETLEPLLEHYGDLVRFVYREYPIIGGQSSANAGAAAQCAGLQGQYWAYTDLIWANQVSQQPRPLDNALLTEFAETVELDMDTFNACLADGTGFDLVVADFEAGRDFDFRATPSFFINGQPFTEGAAPLARFIEVIDAELRAQGIEPPQ